MDSDKPRLTMRPLTQLDVPKIDQIWRKHHAENFGVPSLDNAVAHTITLNDGKVLAGGMLKALGELVMILDLDAPVATRTRALTMLLDQAEKEAQIHGFEQTHIFTDEKFARILENHYGYRRVSGIVLVKEVPING